MSNKKVFIAGVFDCFHQGHLTLLEKASRLGLLTVGVVRDAAVKKQKGENRPINNEYFRMELISKLQFVYDVLPLSDFEFPDALDYDIILVGEDQKHFKNLDSIPFAKHYMLPRLPGVSTSDIIKKMGCQCN